MKSFILKSFFVDDGLTSSSSKEKLLELADSLPIAFSNYSFQIKHVILSFVKSSGITLSDNMERFFGILWDFHSDKFSPALEVWLCRKTRGAHTDTQLSAEMIENPFYESHEEKAFFYLKESL